MNSRWFIIFLMIFIQQQTNCFSFSMPTWASFPFPKFQWPSMAALWDSISFVKKKDLEQLQVGLQAALHADISNLKKNVDGKLNDLEDDAKKNMGAIYKKYENIRKNLYNLRKMYQSNYTTTSRLSLVLYYRLEELSSNVEASHSDVNGLRQALDMATSNDKSICTQISLFETNQKKNYEALNSRLSSLEDKQKDSNEGQEKLRSKIEDGIANGNKLEADVASLGIKHQNLLEMFKKINTTLKENGNLLLQITEEIKPLRSHFNVTPGLQSIPKESQSFHDELYSKISSLKNERNESSSINTIHRRRI